MQPHTLRVATVQVESHTGEVAANLARAERLVREAAAAGAQLVLCPEFLAAGYIYDETIWNSGEPRGGVTEQWVCRLAASCDTFVGATYLEADGDDFYNTFALASPQGEIVGRVRKESLPVFEGWYFKSCDQPKYIDCELGRIGVGICHDNETARFFHHALREQPDLILMPHSAPCSLGVSGLVRKSLKRIAKLYADELGIPVVVANKVGSRTASPIPLVPFVRVRLEFPGLSSIVDSDGTVIEELAAIEGFAIADVHLDPARRRHPPETTGYWARPPKRFPRTLATVMTVLDRAGRRAYGRSRRRVAAARAIGRAVEHPSVTPDRTVRETEHR